MVPNKKSFLIWVSVIFVLGLIILFIWGFNHPKELTINLQKSLSPSANWLNRESFNILLLGVAGNGSRGALLTDTIILLNLNFNKKQVSIFSLPRDLWVEVPHSHSEAKLNDLYTLSNKNTSDFSKATSYNLIQEKIENITGVKINYVIIFDLIGFGKLVDAVGGINIYLDKEMVDPNLVNPHDKSEIFYLSPGWHYLDGAMAIKFVRTRYSASGDFYRMTNQHAIITALKDKFTQLSSVWNLMSWLKIYNSIAGHYITNLDFNTLWGLFNEFKTIKNNQIKYFSITNRPPDNLLISSSVPGIYENATTSVYVLLPRLGFERYDEIQQFVQNSLAD